MRRTVSVHAGLSAAAGGLGWRWGRCGCGMNFWTGPGRESGPVWRWGGSESVPEPRDGGCRGARGLNFCWQSRRGSGWMTTSSNDCGSWTWFSLRSLEIISFGRSFKNENEERFDNLVLNDVSYFYFEYFFSLRVIRLIRY